LFLPSLIPALLHPRVAEAAIRHKKNMVTSSYISPEMQALDAKSDLFCFRKKNHALLIQAHERRVTGPRRPASRS
jgi:saccharopine dehydrogenase-like NADP-dependent oxidoreductase